MTDVQAELTITEAPEAKRSGLPETMLDTFRQFRGSADSQHWGLGDAVADACIELAGRVTQGRIYKAAAIETDCSIAEVRILAETARAFDVSLRDEFNDVLTHQHYRVLRYIDDRSRKQAYLQWCIESADLFGGRPAPAVKLAAKVRRDSGNEPPEPTYGELLERAVRAVEKVLAVANPQQYKRVEAALDAVRKLG